MDDFTLTPFMLMQTNTWLGILWHHHFC